jgi:1,4-dihydroxy-2-naphthoate polyprenyltransferase
MKNILIHPISVFSKPDIIKHMRFVFSFFLLPVFLFGLSQASTINLQNTVMIFIILHFLVYPASNAYNSYMDNDKGSIGGLKNPPPVTKDLYHASIYLDSIAISSGFLISWELGFLLCVYIAISKSYSWRKIRLKKFPFLSWFIVLLFQGGFTFMITGMCAENNFTWEWWSIKKMHSFTAISLMVGGLYPITQIYQHQEDVKRGDRTISSKLGYDGTFLFSLLIFLLSFALLWTCINNPKKYFVFTLFMFPVVTFFLNWFSKTLKNPAHANFENTMKFLFISSSAMNLFFLLTLLFNN